MLSIFKKQEIPRQIESFCGIEIFTYDGWDEIDIDRLQFYDIEFAFSSMEKYNHHDAVKTFDGELRIYDEKGRILFSEYITDIPEVMEELIKRQNKR